MITGMSNEYLESVRKRNEQLTYMGRIFRETEGKITSMSQTDADFYSRFKELNMPLRGEVRKGYIVRDEEGMPVESI